MTTSAGAIVFASLIVLTVGAVLWSLAWASRRGERLGRAAVTTDEAAELMAIAAEKLDAERALEDTIADHPERRAVDRLRKSRWNRDQ